MNKKQRKVIEEALSYLLDMVSAGAEDERTMRLIRDLNEVLFPSLHDARLMRKHTLNQPGQLQFIPLRNLLSWIHCRKDRP